MFMHNKRLMYTLRISEPNPALASLMLEQFGGPQGAWAAAMQSAVKSDPTTGADLGARAGAAGATKKVAGQA